MRVPDIPTFRTELQECARKSGITVVPVADVPRADVELGCERPLDLVQAGEGSGCRVLYFTAPPDLSAADRHNFTLVLGDLNDYPNLRTLPADSPLHKRLAATRRFFELRRAGTLDAHVAFHLGGLWHVQRVVDAGAEAA